MSTANNMSAAAGRRQLISIIIPARNEEGNIARLEQEINSVASSLPYDFEFIVIDNASCDRTGELVKAICGRDCRWRYVRFSRDFSVEMSLAAGYSLARGDAIIAMYSDLQDPPEVILKFVSLWQQGYDVVYGVRTVRPGDPAWRNVAVKVTYRIIRWLSDVPIPANAGDFRLISRRVCDALNCCHEKNRYLRGIIAWLGFPQIGVTYERRPRTSGVSKVGLARAFVFTLDAITSFSLRPLRLFTLAGFILLVASGTGAVVVSVLTLLGVGAPARGVTTLIVLALAGIGLNSLGIGTLGEYVGRIYGEVKSRPLYVIEDTVNMGPGSPADLP